MFRRTVAPLLSAVRSDICQDMHQYHLGMFTGLYTAAGGPLKSRSGTHQLIIPAQEKVLWLFGSHILKTKGCEDVGKKCHVIYNPK
jgi:hypothetical protein